MERKLNILFYFIIIFVSSINGQNIQFSHLSTSDKLSHVSAITLYVDEYNYIWIGTREGLNRYDGLNVETYTLQENDTNSLFSNNIQKITGNKAGSLFILSTEGVCEYNIAKDRFSTLWQDNHIKSIYYEKDLYLGRNRDIYKYNRELKKFDLQYTLPSDATSITSLFVDSLSHTIYAGTNAGLYLVSQSGNIEHPIKIKSNVSSIYKDNDNEIWVSTWNDGVFRITNKGVQQQFLHQPLSRNSIASNFVRDCCQDDLGNIWIATFSGLNKYDKKTGQFALIVPNKKPDGLSHSSVWSIIKDHQGSLWLGTYFGGVNYFNPEHVIYTQYEQSRTESEGLSSPIVGRMTEDSRGNLWICTEGAGVNVFNRTTGKFKWYLPQKGDNSISHNNVKAIYHDEVGDAMWFGTHLGGLDKLDLKTGRFSHYRYNANDPQSIPSNIVRDIVAKGRKLYLATDNGVGVLDVVSGKCTMLLSDSVRANLVNNTFALHLDHSNNLWISVMGEGVYCYSIEKDELKNYRHIVNDENSLSNNNINSITQDSNNILYFCTSGRGFDSYNTQTGVFKNYDSKKNNLIGNFVYNIVEATPEDYLVITNLGLSRFNPRTEKIRNYNTNNNFPLSTINDNALYLASDGEVFLGGVDGLVSFNINDLDFTPKNYDIRFSKLYVNSKEVDVDDETGILKEALFKTSSIKLDAAYNTFEVEITTTNYIPSNAEGLLYQLKGFSEEWLPLRDSKITYTNLDAGKYTLVIKNDTYNDNDAFEEVASLKIEILPPFYKSSTAYLVYAVLFFLITFSLIRAYKNKIKLKASLAYEQKHLLDVEMLNQSKLRFFTNISHEFRTPLTVIIGQLDYLINKHSFTSDVYDKILSVYKNSIQMKDLISELLDFRKQEQGHMTIAASEHDIVEFVKENFLLFEEYAKTKEIEFSFHTDVDKLSVWYDSRQLQKVLNNLISNAFKYTPSAGIIELSIVHDESSCSILVKDSGSGIKTEELDKIFDRFYQIEDQVHSGSGIGLALSMGIVKLHHGKLEVENNTGQGAIFKVILPLGCSHLPHDSINQSESADKAIIRPLRDFVYHQSGAPVVKLKSSKDSKILIVEDNDDLRNMLHDLFASDYDVICASDGKEGLDKVYAERPDIILSDIVMPNMTGIELCKAVKTDINICHIPLILLTAKTSVEHNLEGLGIGADDYITKPFDANILISRCNNLVTGRRLLQQVFSQQPDIELIQLATNSLDKDLIQQAIDIVDKNLDNIDFSINDFCKAMGMSRTNLFTKIKALTNQTPNAFIMTIRLKKAAQLLRQRLDLNISEISVITGFNTSHYFSKCFKDIYKKTPTEFREGE